MNLMKLNPSKIFSKFNTKKNHKILFFFLIIFSVYCSLIVGKSWDEGAHLKFGKNTLNYLFSFGKIDNSTLYREHFSPIYWSLQYLLTQIFPNKYEIEVTHLVNLLFSLSAIIGVGKLTKELFNEQVGKIVFLVLFFYPIFFGHMSFNGKDMFLAFCHVWIFYLVIKYLKNQNIKDKANKYAQTLSNSLMLVGDGLDPELLESENIYEIDCFVSATENEQTNMMASMLIKDYSVKQNIVHISTTK